ncbi:hypothetical protein C3942_07490 [Solimonas fluminis]|uniref:Uncharacterized protein n=1 Tax=Solimonas fluminis TaxID=2086571 RepID=A0A2S5TI25_9GAMM|nr:hypothetical protein [Solimonas fluminis]PPE74597.1 hypothetical protein C3942_07490 [Solimonas fluminis]
MNDQIKLSKKEAYKAMFLFLEREYQLTKSDDIGSLLGAMQFLGDGVPADPAAWEDWEECVGQALREGGA